MTGTTSDEPININDNGTQQELKYHVVDELLNEQVQEVKIRTKNREISSSAFHFL
mgnify:CR=1 FL=1